MRIFSPHNAILVLLPWLAIGLFVCSSLSARGADPVERDVEFFEKKIRPLLAQHCYECHGPDVQESGLRLDRQGNMRTGGDSGPAVVPGNAEQSLLLAAVTYADEALQMPPDERLPDESIALFRRWILAGAPSPETSDEHVVSEEFNLAQARQFWAFRPVQAPEVPQPKSPGWVRTPVDAFILEKLKSQHLAPVAEASKRTLIRRATFDLIGLPPTPEEVQAFLADDSPDAYRALIERLLESPHYGERWGRHWLDVARYADSNGLDENIAHGNAWRYRDYVVAAFNADKPFDRFVQEQIAGDLLLEECDSDALRRDALTATGFLSLGPKVLAEGDETKMQMDIVDEQIDTIGRAFLGMTLGCARCHSHKFDPISQADYYALAGIFQSTRTMESLKRIAKWNENSIATAEERAAKESHESRLAAHKSRIEELMQRAQAMIMTETGELDQEDVESLFPEEVRTELGQLREELKQLEGTIPELPTAMGVQDGELVRPESSTDEQSTAGVTPVEIQNARIHVRGSHLTLGREVIRGVPVVLMEGSPLEIGASESGRRQLADWLVDRRNPLTARVMVNRVWRWHFGRGLVATTNNFGNLGERPSHPALLDWLAAEFMESGWSIKSLHRLIMLSRVYQLASVSDPDNVRFDADNQWYWRHEPQRLEAEAIRDSLLAVSGLLDRTMGGSQLHVANREFIFNHTSRDETSYDAPRRSLYLPVIRNNLYDGFSLFDYTDASVPNGDRATSTIAPQALFLLNSDLIADAAQALAERLLATGTDNPESQVTTLYERVLGRLPTPRESERIQRFLIQFQQEIRNDEVRPEPMARAAWTAICQSLLASNEFFYIE